MVILHSLKILLSVFLVVINLNDDSGNGKNFLMGFRGSDNGHRR